MTTRLKIFAGVLVGILLVAVPVQSQPFATQIQLAVNALITGVTPYTRLRITASNYINWGSASDATGYGLRDNAGSIQVKNSGGVWTTITGLTGNPIDASYWTRVDEAALTNETAMSSLATALVLNTAGVPSAYAGTTCTNQFVRSLNGVAAATCATVALSTDTSGTLAVSRGGTNLTVGTSGGILAFTGTTTLASSAALAANQLVIGGGAGVVPSTLGSLGTTTTLLHGNASGAPTFAAVSLTADVTGILATANGGTGNAFFALSGPATSTKTYTLPNASTTILTTNAAVTAAQGGTGIASYTVGDLLYASGATTLSALADIATGNALLSGGVGVAPAYGKIGLTTHITGTLPTANGGTGLTGYTAGDVIYASSATTLAGRAAVAIGQVLISQGAGIAPIWSDSPQVETIKLDTTLTFSGATPTISSGFGTSPSVLATGTTAAFQVNVGTGGTASAGVLGMPAAGSRWVCNVLNLTAAAGNRADQRTIQTASTSTTVTVQNQTISSGAAAAWTASDQLAISCAAF